MINEIIVETGTILESLNNKVDLDGGNYIGSGLETYINKNSKSGFNLFDTKISDHILQGKEAKGWALQGTYVTKESYPNFYNKCLEEYQNSSNTKQWLKSNITKVGSVVDNQGVLSGFSTSNYATVNGVFPTSSSTWEMVLKVTTDAIGTLQEIINTTGTHTLLLRLQTTGLLSLYLSSTGSSWDIASNISSTTTLTANTTYYIKFTFDGTAYKLYLSTNGVNFQEEINIANSSSLYPSQTCLGVRNTGTAISNPFLGSIDLNSCYININGERWWTSVDVMTRNHNGHKFYSIEQKSSIDEIYNQYGIADYYGIDEENERVFLPRNKNFQQLTDDISKVNEMMEAGLPNHYHYEFNTGSGSGDGQATVTALQYPHVAGVGGYSSYRIGGTSTVPTIGKSSGAQGSGVYGKSDTVQPPSSLKLLYYCVGNTEVTSAITNVTEVTTSENDTIPLFTGMYFDFKPNNVSWLKAGEQQNNAGIYKTCYNTLVEIVNGVNNYDLKVINQADMVSGVDYDEYWILDQDNLTFRTPLAIATKSLSGGVAGNGMTLGLTDGTNNAGLYFYNSSNYADNLSIHSEDYGKNVGEKASGSYPTSGKTYGITTDPTKSGIIAKQSTAQLYFKVANAVQNLELLDAGEVLESLADKLDRGNKEEITSWGMPDYNAVVAVTFPFTAPTVGALNISTNKSQTGKHVMTINDKTVAGHHNSSNQYYTNIGGQFFLNKGDVVKLDANLSVQVAVFCPLKGDN